MKTFIVLSCLLAVALATPNLARWNQWKQHHGRSYEQSEELRRMKIFHRNLKLVEQHNAEADAGKHTFRLGLNKFADLTSDEFATQFNRYKFNPLEHKQRNPRRVMASSPLPESVDWRTKGVVGPIKDQGQCGSCWAFATVAATEGQHALATKNLTLLSEQNLVDCSQREGNNGCDGGLMDYGFQYIIDNEGIDTEESYPYTAQDGRCHFKRRFVGAKVTGYVDIPTGDELALQNATATIGPIAVGIDASSYTFQLYESGVYVDHTCSSEYLDHGVTVVGYGSLNKVPYWIVRNSWGDSWGQEGYIWMSRNADNMCGIATAASYPIVPQN